MNKDRYSQDVASSELRTVLVVEKRRIRKKKKKRSLRSRIQVGLVKSLLLKRGYSPVMIRAWRAKGRSASERADLL